MATVFGADQLYFLEPVGPPLSVLSSQPSDVPTIIIGGSGLWIGHGYGHQLSADNDNIDAYTAFGVVPSTPWEVIYFLGNTFLTCISSLHA